jgi:hypothetical protein
MKAKIILSVIQIVGLMILLILLAIGLVIVVANDATTWHKGYISIAAFLLAAYIFGTVTNKVINNVKRLWE